MCVTIRNDHGNGIPIHIGHPIGFTFPLGIPWAILIPSHRIPIPIGNPVGWELMTQYWEWEWEGGMADTSRLLN